MSVTEQKVGNIESTMAELEDPALEELTRQRVYALAMSDDTMRLLDCGAF